MHDSYSRIMRRYTAENCNRVLSDRQMRLQGRTENSDDGAVYTAATSTLQKN
jgi:hypothetical protein